MSSASSFSGQVVKGNGRGTALGFPTANLRLTDASHRPPDGVYACLGQIMPASPPYQAIMHVGPRPSFPGSIATVEIHLLDFSYQSLYGKTIQVSHIIYLRPIKKFPHPVDLVQAIKQDKKQAQHLLNQL